jgi:hypothetical protein
VIHLISNKKKGCCPIFYGMASLIVLMSTGIISSGQTITVKQDGTGDFTVIQDAADIAVDGDTVLVFPGIYYENVDITDKGIILASTWLFTQADSSVHQTIIDGNEQGSCIRTLSGNTWVQVIGFTLRHGTGTNTITTHPDFYGHGGGIYIRDSKVELIHNIIKDNFAWAGGGILLNSSSTKFKHNIITNNWAVGPGGGIRSTGSIIEFDSLLLNNIMLNFAAWGSDIAFSYNDSVAKVWIDTCSVFNPDQYYIGKFSDWAIHMDRPPISVLHGKIEQVNADLYVDPSGDDGNSGLTADDPLNTISFALIKIATDSISPKTVHVADGTYSYSLTGEHTPLQLKNYVNLIGQSRENTIIDSENKYEGARFPFGQDYTYVSNLSFANGNGTFTSSAGGITIGYSRKVVLDNVALLNATSMDYIHGLYSDSDDTLIINNSLIKDCYGRQTIVPFNHYDEPPRYIEFISTQFENNRPGPDYDTSNAHLTVFLLGSEFIPDMIYAKFNNCLFNDNTDSVEWAKYPGATAITAKGDCYVDIVNCTFTNNTSTNPWGGAVGTTYGSDIHIYNSILYGNEQFQAYLNYSTPDQADTMSVHYSLVQDGQEGIVNYGAYNVLSWGEGNLDNDPLFLGTDDHPYALDYGSPCIDAGTLNLPLGIELPEYDIAGNPRVWGESVDMGAYEYGPWVRVPEAPPVVSRQSSVVSHLQVSPNPFSYGTYVSYELKEKGSLNISVYSLSGRKVNTLINRPGSLSGEGKFYWDGYDQDGNKLPSGTYLIRMTVEDKLLEVLKVVKSD